MLVCMKIGEALTQRAELVRKIQELDGRIAVNATSQEGDAPAEDPNVLLTESARVTDELEALITRINLTNALTTLEDGTPITAALARRDTLATRVRTLQKAIQAAQSTGLRYSMTEIKTVKHLDVAALQAQHDAYATERRALDAAIQAHNWSTDVQGA